MEAITVYKCGFCKKIYRQKGNCKRHENRCYHNPSTKSCASCGYFSYEDVINSDGFVRSKPFCAKAEDLSNKNLRTGCAEWIDRDKITYKEIIDTCCKNGTCPSHHILYSIYERTGELSDV